MAVRCTLQRGLEGPGSIGVYYIIRPTRFIPEGEEIRVRYGSRSEERSSRQLEDADQAAEDAALEEAANAVKQAMKAAEVAVNSKEEGDDDESHIGEEKEATEDAGYETPAEDEDIDAAISAASSDDSDCPQE